MSVLSNDWVSISADSGTGDTDLTASVTEQNTGRNNRSVVVVGTTDNGATARATISQGGTREFVDFAAGSYTIANDGTYVIITGTSNSSKLTFSFPAIGTDETDFLDLPASFSATLDGETQTIPITSPATALNPDWGATDEYTFSIRLTTKNTTPASQRTRRLIVTADNGATDTANITQFGVSSTILFDGLDEGTVYDATSVAALTISIGVTPEGEGWTLSWEQ